jgi:hypothetical protein
VTLIVIGFVAIGVAGVLAGDFVQGHERLLLGVPCVAAIA